MTNEEHLELMKDHEWWPAIKQCHDTISEVVPNYRIAQIKEKFGGLRFYYSLPEPEEIDWGRVPERIQGHQSWGRLHDWCEGIVDRAEAWVEGYEYAKRRRSNE